MKNSPDSLDIPDIPDSLVPDTPTPLSHGS